MFNKNRNEKGITLVELLAVLAIGGILMVLIMGIFSNGQNHYSSQTTKAGQLNDIRYAAKVITKEIRKAEKVEIISSGLKLGIDSPVIFTFEDNEVLQDGSPLVTGIKEFTVTEDERTVQIRLVSNEQRGQSQNVETEIFLREGVIVE